jgi:hypothetical protein
MSALQPIDAEGQRPATIFSPLSFALPVVLPGL